MEPVKHILPQPLQTSPWRWVCPRYFSRCLICSICCAFPTIAAIRRSKSDFNEIRNASLLVLDDFGTQNATGWAQEKLFQILNYRYINKLPLVVTTNLLLDEIEACIRLRPCGP